MSVEGKVGAFVIACMLLLGISVYAVGNNHWGHRLTSYKTYLRYAGGVGPGTDVLFGGINAGRVTGVKPWNEDPTQIEITLQVNEGTPLNEDSVAKLGSVSIMSSPAISITTGDDSAPRLKPGQVIRSQETVSIDEMTRKLATIADSAGGLVTQVRGELKDITGDSRRLLANLNDITGPPNRQQLAQTLRRVNSLVRTQSPKIDRITDQVLSVSQNIDSVIAKISPLVDHTDGAVSKADRTVDALRDPVRQDLAELQSTLAQARSTLKAVQTLVRANDENITETVDNLRVATENLDQLTDQVKQRPWSLIRIRQPKDRKFPQ